MKKSPNDNRNYQSVTLSNGIRLVYVEDKACNKSACSLVVNTGSFDDPTDRPGFAHFIEHLLFNGNKKYPTPNSLPDFVAKHGGHINAWTATEHSSFHFDVNHDSFASALDQFANLFISPLFTDDAIKREQEAIHAEYKLKLRDDSRRIQQVHKETCNPKHPFHKFAVGNRQTLSDLPQRPVKDEILTFWQNNYQAQFMTVAIVAQSFEWFDLAQQLLSEISSKNPLQSKPVITQPLYSKKDLGRFICIRPVKELHKLNLTFALPSIDHLYQHKMVSFIAHIIGHEGSGSLYESLKRQGLINGLSAGNGISGQNFKDFNISVELTELGESRLDLIMTQLFSFINYMKANLPPEYLYIEQQKMAQIGFDYQEPTKAIKLSNQIALNMHHYPEEDFLYGDFRMDGFELGHWNQIFNFFEPDNMRITLASQNISPDKEAHWYHTPYSEQDIDKSVIDELKGLCPNDGTFAYPSPNPYLEHDIQIEQKDFHSTIPISLNQELGWQCWFKQDLRFMVPKGNIYIGLDLPHGVSSNKSQALMRLFCELFMDEMADVHYQSEMAGLHYNLYAHTSGITLYTSGLSANQASLINKLVSSLPTISPTRSRFEEVKRQLVKHWRNSESNKPISQLFSLLNAHLLPTAATSQQLAQELEHISVEEYNEFATTLFSDVYVEILIYGNWTTSQATVINEDVKHLFENSTRVEELPKQFRLLEDNGILELSKKIDHQDSASLLYLQGLHTESVTNNEIEKAYFILASQILAPYTFNLLRTEKQLGYMVGGGYMPISNIPGLAVYVQSHDYSSERLTSELHDCLLNFIDELESLSLEDFERHKSAVIMQYKEKPTNLAQQSQQLWVSISNKDYQFNQKDKIVNELLGLTKQHMVSWYSALFSPLLNKGILVNSK
ncbi:insulinase family protein [Psychrosphaera aestuarii]|uniref:insulinase family protein n=1 Tax=Psychrosphaera aestuarii TaxID=1266052 RepID=UPI001B31DA88|nr:insulinase family protein [Psychrosphaera aestuarii]